MADIDYGILAHIVRNEATAPVMRYDELASHFIRTGRPKAAETCQVAIDAIMEVCRLMDGLAKEKAQELSAPAPAPTPAEPEQIEHIAHNSGDGIPN